MVVEKSVLMKVVFPKPDSPATYNTCLAHEAFEPQNIGCFANHNRKCGSTLGHDFVSENTDLALEIRMARRARRSRVYL